MAPCMQQLPAVVVKLFPYRFFFLLPPLIVSCCGPLLAGQKHMCEEHFHFTVRDRYLFFPPQSDIQPQESKLGANQVKVVSEPERIGVFLTRSSAQVTDISCGVVYEATLAFLVLFRSYCYVEKTKTQGKNSASWIHLAQFPKTQEKLIFWPNFQGVPLNMPFLFTNIFKKGGKLMFVKNGIELLSKLKEKNKTSRKKVLSDF